jgi:hypothetical protein
MKFFALIIISLIIIPVSGLAQNDDWKITGHLQLRSELDGRDFNHKTYPRTFASLRTRLGVEKSLSNLNFFVQFQDSRVFGEEPSTLSNLQNIDLHQGYVTLSNPFDLPFSLQAGRMEVVYGTERFFGAVGWHYVGRSWDGVRLKIKSGFNLDLFALTRVETQKYIGNAVPMDPVTLSQPTRSASVYGLWSSFVISPNNQLDPFIYYDVDRVGEISYSGATAGLNYFFKHANSSVIFEGAYQFGDNLGLDISAYLLSLQLMHNVSSFKFGAGADLLSGLGDERGTVYRNFNPAYGTNHKFYGFMDYFINIPMNTYSLGLNDYYMTAALQPQDSKISANIWVHYFTPNKKAGDLSSFGQEVDLTVIYNFFKGTSITWGGSVFIPGNIMRASFQRPDTAFWSYVMITAGI